MTSESALESHLFRGRETEGGGGSVYLLYGGAFTCPDDIFRISGQVSQQAHRVDWLQPVAWEKADHRMVGFVQIEEVDWHVKVLKPIGTVLTWLHDFDHKYLMSKSWVLNG